MESVQAEGDLFGGRRGTTGRHEIKLHNKALCFANHICLAWGGGGIAMGAIVVEHVHCRQDDMLTHSQKTGSVECSCLSHLSTYHFYL